MNALGKRRRGARRGATSMIEVLAVMGLFAALLTGIGQVWWLQRRVGTQTESTIALAQRVERLAFRLRVDARDAQAALAVAPPADSPPANAPAASPPAAAEPPPAAAESGAAEPVVDPDAPVPAIQLPPAPPTSSNRTPRGGWDLVGSDERVVEYRVEGSTVRRTARRGAQVVHRDSFRLPVGSMARLLPADPAAGRPLPQVVITRPSVERTSGGQASDDEGTPLVVIDLALKSNTGAKP